MKQVYIYSLLLIICLAGLGLSGYFLTNSALLLQHKPEYKKMYLTISILATVSVLFTILLLVFRVYAVSKQIYSKDKWLNRSLYFAVILLLIVGIYSSTLASQLQCLTSDPLVYQIWNNTKNVSLIGIIGAFCVLVVMFIYKKNDILKELGIEITKEKDDDKISVKDIERVQKFLGKASDKEKEKYYRPIGRDAYGYGPRPWGL